MNVLAIIPARAGSKGVPDKNIRLLAGQPLLGWSLQAALESRLVTHVAVTSDSARYLGIVDDLVESLDVGTFGIASALSGQAGPRERVLRVMRPPYLATDEASTDRTMAHALRSAEDVSGLRYDLVVLLQPTVPVRRPGLVDDCIEHMLGRNADCLLTVNRAHFVWERFAGLYLSNTGLDRPRRQDFQPQHERWLEDGSVYVSRRDLFDQILPARLGGQIALLEIERTVDIDTEEDLAIAAALLHHRASSALREAS